LRGHPLLAPAVIAGLTDAVAPSEITHHRGDLPVLLPRGDAPALDLEPAAVARGIPDNGCWLRVGSLQRIPEWDALLRECLVDVGDHLDAQAQVFLAAPGAVTPAHFDTYHNLLLQIDGTKEVSIGTFTEPRDAQREIARHFGRERENLRVLPPEVSTFVLEPGEGLYIPPYAFHWARVGDGASLAMSCNFSDRASERARLVHVCNERLRRLGIDAAPPGRSRLRDWTKITLLRSWRTTRGLAQPIVRARAMLR
jgi:Cupin superfamily protein